MSDNENGLRNALKEMRDIIELSKEDPEVAHVKADKILCDVLKEEGYNKLVELYYDVKKYYA